MQVVPILVVPLADQAAALKPLLVVADLPAAQKPLLVAVAQAVVLRAEPKLPVAVATKAADQAVALKPLLVVADLAAVLNSLLVILAAKAADQAAEPKLPVAILVLLPLAIAVAARRSPAVACSPSCSVAARRAAVTKPLAMLVPLLAAHAALRLPLQPLLLRLLPLHQLRLRLSIQVLT